MGLLKEIGLKIKELRENLNLTQELFAERINIDVGFLSRVENGHRNITVTTLEKIANGLNHNFINELVNIKSEEMRDRAIIIKDINEIISEMDNTTLEALYKVIKFTPKKDSNK